MAHLRMFGIRRPCVYCGGSTGTRDHVPSRILLDEPYPSNLPVVPACDSCNQAFSLDEEYLACWIECSVVGTVDLAAIQRNKVRRILGAKPALAARLNQARQVAGQGTVFELERERVEKVLLKLARGHAAFELKEPRLGAPPSLVYAPVPSLTSAQRERFGLRESGWIGAQPERYRHLASANGEVVIRMVLSEHLACEVVWG